ncbi:MAG TPA: FecR domain-containing protein, partial [Chthoniobacterales bacterium]|nr:FecR domain-containing protein [Chthoniobacterales bacterium]
MNFAAGAYVRRGLKPLWPGVLGLALTAATGCTGKVSREVNATLLAVDGSSLVQGLGSNGTSRPATAQAPFRAGETLRTNSDGTVAAMLVPGALVRLAPRSEIRLERLAITKDGNATDEAMSRAVSLRLLEGTIDLVVQFESEPGKFRLETPVGTLSTLLPGTCRVAFQSGQLRLTCIRGAFDFLPAGGQSPVTLKAGYFQQWPDGQPEPSAIETDATAQDEIDQSLNVERKLLEL